MRSIEAFYNYCNSINSINIVVALPKQQIDFWNELCAKHNFTIKHTVVAGGETRFHSVKNSLSAIPDNGLVGIHDAVRPLINKATIDNCYSTAATKGNAIPAVDLVDSIRKLDKLGIHKMVDRNNYKLIQTPQVFDIETIKEAYKQNYNEKFTDDASVLEEYNGTFINLVEGNKQNIKITLPEDLIYADAVLKNYKW